MSEQELVLSVRHVTSGYRDRGLFRRGPYQEVLRDVTFDVRHGEILGLVGESGTGKSTLARTILGIVKPDQAGDSLHQAAPDDLSGPVQRAEPRLFGGVDPGGAAAGLRQV